MKKVVSSSIITLLILFLAAAAFFYFRNFRYISGDPVMAIPSDAAWVQVWEPGSGTLEQLLNFDNWEKLRKAPNLEQAHANLAALDSLLKNHAHFRDELSVVPVFVSAHMTGAGSFDFLFLQSQQGRTESAIDDLFAELAGPEPAITRRNYDGNSIRELTLKGGATFAYTLSRGVLLASFTPFLVEDALRQFKVGKAVLSDWAIGQLNKDGGQNRIAVSFSNLSAFLGNFSNPASAENLLSFRKFAPWASGAAEIRKDGIRIRGSIEPGDSLSFQGCFSEQDPVAKKMFQILPNKIAMVSWIGSSDFQKFQHEYSRRFNAEDLLAQHRAASALYLKKYRMDIRERLLAIAGGEMALVITEPAGTDFTNQCYAIVGTKSREHARQILKEICVAIDKQAGFRTTEEQYNQHSIGLVRLQNIPELVYGTLFSKVKSMYYTFVGDYLVIANQAASLRVFIDDVEVNRKLANAPVFLATVREMPEKANCFFYVNPSAGRYLLKSVVNDTWKKYAEAYRDVFRSLPAFAFQAGGQRSGFAFKAALSFGPEKAEPGVQQVFTIDADSTVSMQPLVTSDSTQSGKRILFQDNSGTLTCADQAGNILWKRQINGDIVGTIHEIDLFHNGERQYLFNTIDFLFLFDSEGRPAGNYPIRLPAKATNALSVCDFGNSDEARIYVACQNGKIYAYTAPGKPLAGWMFNQNMGMVRRPVLQVSMGSRDGLYITDDQGSIAIVSPFGELLFPLLEHVYPAAHHAVFTTPTHTLLTTDTSGAIVEIDSSGRLTKSPLVNAMPGHGFLYADADGDHKPDYILTQSSELIALNADLSILYRKNFGVPLESEITYMTRGEGNFLIGIRSVAAGKTWLVTADGIPMHGFPVEGCSPPAVGALNTEGGMYLVTGGCSSGVRIYSIR